MVWGSDRGEGAAEGGEEEGRRREGEGRGGSCRQLGASGGGRGSGLGLAGDDLRWGGGAEGGTVCGKGRNKIRRRERERLYRTLAGGRGDREAAA